MPCFTKCNPTCLKKKANKPKKPHKELKELKPCNVFILKSSSQLHVPSEEPIYKPPKNQYYNGNMSKFKCKSSAIMKALLYLGSICHSAIQIAT